MVSEWKIVKLSEVALVNPTYKLNNGQEYAFVDMASVSEEHSEIKSLINKVYNKQSASKFKNGDILFARITPCTENGKTALVNGLNTYLGFGSTEFIVLSPLEDKLNSIFLFYCVKWNRYRNKAISRMVGTTGRQRVPNEFFKEELEILLPPLPEQQKIADILSSVDEAISKTAAIIEQTEKVKKGLMQELLTKGIGHTKFKQTEIGEIPEEWGIASIIDVSVFQPGYAFASKDSVSEGIRWLKIANVSAGNIDWSDESYLPERYQDEYKAYLLQKDNLVMAMTRPIINNQVKVAKLRSSDTPSLLNQRVGRFITNDKMNNDYLYHFLRSQVFITQLKDKIIGTDPPNVSSKQIESLRIPIPSKVEQYQIIKILNNIDLKLSLGQQKLTQLQTLKKGLMQDLLTGKVRVKLDN